MSCYGTVRAGLRSLVMLALRVTLVMRRADALSELPRPVLLIGVAGMAGIGMAVALWLIRRRAAVAPPNDGTDL